MTLPRSYFDGVYDGSPDPWGFTERFYEQRKYALTLAALPHERYRRALEVGCSIGVLTARLAERCDHLLALDPSPVALSSARRRVPVHVQLHQAAVPADWVTGSYDLVVLSEVLYYLSEPDLDALLDLVVRDLAPGGAVVACHWRHPVADYPQTGDAVHEALGARLRRTARLEEEDFLLDVLAREATSVARRTGLLG